MEIIGAGFGILFCIAMAAFGLLMLLLRGSGAANDAAEQQEIELLRQRHDDEAMERITR